MESESEASERSFEVSEQVAAEERRSAKRAAEKQAPLSPITFVASDVTILDLLRQRGGMSVAELSEATEVTQTAVRQRLSRLLAQGLIERRARRVGRGRPSHRYRLTEAGRRKVGANFGDLAVVLWEEIRAIEDPEVRRGLIQRLAVRLAERYGLEVEGSTVSDRMESVARLFGQRDVPFAVNRDGADVELQALACPYPDLAEQDRTICAMEKMLFDELLGRTVRLSACRFEGSDCCTFTTHRAEGEHDLVDLEARPGAPTDGTKRDKNEAR